MPEGEKRSKDFHVSLGVMKGQSNLKYFEATLGVSPTCRGGEKIVTARRVLGPWSRLKLKNNSIHWQHFKI